MGKVWGPPSRVVLNPFRVGPFVPAYLSPDYPSLPRPVCLRQEDKIRKQVGDSYFFEPSGPSLPSAQISPYAKVACIGVNLL